MWRIVLPPHPEPIPKGNKFIKINGEGNNTVYHVEVVLNEDAEIDDSAVGESISFEQNEEEVIVYDSAAWNETPLSLRSFHTLYEYWSNGLISDAETSEIMMCKDFNDSSMDDVFTQSEEFFDLFTFDDGLYNQTNMSISEDSFSWEQELDDLHTILLRPKPYDYKFGEKITISPMISPLKRQPEHRTAEEEPAVIKKSRHVELCECAMCQKWDH